MATQGENISTLISAANDVVGDLMSDALCVTDRRKRHAAQCLTEVLDMAADERIRGEARHKLGILQTFLQDN